MRNFFKNWGVAVGLLLVGSVVVAANVPGFRLASGKIFIGDSSGNAQPITLSGDVTVTNAGVTSLAANGIVSADLDQNVIQVNNTQLTNAQILALEATPITLISAPAANTAVVVHKLCFVLDAAAGAYTESSDDFVVEYATGGVDIVKADNTDGLDDAVVTTRCYTPLHEGTPIIIAAANTACTTTCGGLECMFGDDGTVLTSCSDAGADSCACRGYSVIGTAASAVQLTTVGSGELGGGNAANTLSVRIWYSLQPTVAFSTGG